MSDITFMKGYGFPKGSQMDYAGYNGMLVNTRRRPMNAYQRIPFSADPGLFEKIPALDGFGSEYVMLPEADLSPGAPDINQQPGWGPSQSPAQSRPNNGVGLLIGAGILAFLFLR